MPGGVEVEAAVAHYCETLTDASSPASLAQDNILMGSYNMKHETVVYEPCEPINIWGPTWTATHVPRNATILDTEIRGNMF